MSEEQGYTVNDLEKLKQPEFMRPEAVAWIRADFKDAEEIIANYEQFFANLSKATYEGSAVVRTPENAEFVMAREVPWEELPSDIKRAWGRAGMDAGFVFRDQEAKVMNALRAGTRRKAVKLGELPADVPKQLTE
jgi:hypothetical protein